MKHNFESLCQKAAKATQDAVHHSKLNDLESATLALVACRLWSLRAEWALKHGGMIMSDEFSDADNIHAVPEDTLKQALSFYADSKMWFGAPAAIYKDSGAVARKALNQPVVKGSRCSRCGEPQNFSHHPWCPQGTL